MRLAVCVVPFVPEIVKVVVFDTVCVVTVGVAVVLPAVTVTPATQWLPRSNCSRV